MFARLLPLLIAIAVIPSRASAPSQWDWIAPQPHRQTWVDLTTGTNGFVGLTDGFGARQIYHSLDGSQWTVAQVPERAGLRRVIFANGNYISVGAQESVLSSPDGSDWQVRHENSLGGVLFDIAYGNGAYVAVGYNSTALVSKDLKTWHTVDFPSGYSLIGVAFGNGTFVAVANSGIIYRSVDGRAWASSPWPSALGAGDPAMFEAGLAFGAGKFALSVSGGTAVSADGIAWNVVSTAFYRKISAIGEGFAATAADRLDVSQDGATWRTTLSNPNSRDELNAVAALNSSWIAAGDNGLLYTSADGEHWGTPVSPIDYTHSNVSFANGLFIRFGMEPGQFLSADGKVWVFNTNAPALGSVGAGNGIAVGITASGTIAVSTDLTNWDEINPPAAPRGDVIFGNGIFLCAAAGGVLVSGDGRAWDLATVPGVSSIRLVGFQNGVFAALSNSAQPLTSPDGRNWTVSSTQPDMAAQFYAAGNGRFVGIGGGGLGPGFVTWSADGAHWQRQRLASGSSYSYTGLTFGGGYFLMTDDSGGIFYSTDGITWAGEKQAPQGWTSAAYGNGAWIVAGGDSILRCVGTMAATAAASLQLSQANLSTWSLTLSGTVGERWQIESANGVGANWLPLQIVEIPASGKAIVPLSPDQSAAIFRAVIQP